MAAPLITAITTVPNRENATNQASFSNDTDTFFREVNDFQNEANAQAQYLDGVAAQVDASEAAAAASSLEASGYASTAIDARDAAIASAAYKGTWEGKTSAGVLGESYSYQGSYIYRLNVNLANLSTSEPSPTNTDWQLINVVPFEAPCKPTLDLDFANQDFTIYDKLGGFVKRPLADLVSQGRATSGSSTDAIGGITEFAAGENRFTFDGETGEALGYLSEESRTNLLTNSEFPNGLSDAPSRSGLVSLDSMEFGKGTVNAVAFGYDGVTAISTAYKAYNSYIVGQKYAFSVFVEMSDGLPPQFNSDPSSGSTDFIIVANAAFFTNPDLIIVEKSYGKTYRVGVSLVATSSTGVVGVRKEDSNSPRTFKVSGWQLEEGGSFGSYTSTLGSSVSRSPDSMTHTLGQEWSPNEGAFVIGFDDLEDVANSVIFSTNDGTADNYTKLYQTAAGLIALESCVSGVVTTSIIAPVNRSIGKIKCAIALGKSSALISINGGSVSTSELANATDLYSQLDIGHQLGSSVATAKISDFSYYPRAFDNLTLQRLSRIK